MVALISKRIMRIRPGAVKVQALRHSQPHIFMAYKNGERPLSNPPAIEGLRQVGGQPPQT